MMGRVASRLVALARPAATRSEERYRRAAVTFLASIATKGVARLLLRETERASSIDIDGQKLRVKGAPVLAHLGHERLTIPGSPHDRRMLSIDRPYDHLAVTHQVFEKRRALGQEALDLRQGHRLDAHERDLLEALLADALEKDTIVPFDGFEGCARRHRVFRFARILSDGLCFGQAGA